MGHLRNTLAILNESNESPNQDLQHSDINIIYELTLSA